MTDDDVRQLGTALAEYAQVIAGEHDVRDILEALGDHCTQLLPVHGVGVLLAEDDGLVVATANTEAGAVAEGAEVDLAEGPCVAAVRTGSQVLISDLADVRDEYPRFVPRALDAGIRAVYALPMTSRMEVVGALDVVATEPVVLSHAQLATAQALADVTMAYLANSRAREATSRLAAQLQHALDSRVVVEQAKGMLAERHGEAPQVAFERLRGHARRTRASVQVVAQQVIAGELSL